MSDFYWRHARDSLLTPAALQMFQLLALQDGKAFDEVKTSIDADYRMATGSEGARNGGIIQTQLQVFREAGWATLEKDAGGKMVIVITPAGRQALFLLTKLPDFLKAAPSFIIELLSRYQLKNPARPDAGKNKEYEEQLVSSDVFPYWTLFKILRSVENVISSTELKRIVFKIHRQEDLPAAIEKIKLLRTRMVEGADAAELDAEFGSELEGSVGEPKYLMGRLGTQVGHAPPVLEKDGQSHWRLNPGYLPLIDELLSNPPQFEEYLSESAWMQKYALPVPFIDGEDLIQEDDLDASLDTDLPDDDEVLVLVQELVAAGSAGVLLSGPPGTSKTWYARKIAGRLCNGRAGFARFVQFHPSMGYDDFVEGYVPTVQNHATTFEVRKKIFLQFSERAALQPDELHVLVIDEVNRGDVSRIFGELLTYLEPEYREISFRLAYSGRITRIPKNLFVIGTFNPYDKSVVELDDALDRRFDRIALDPSASMLKADFNRRGIDAELTERVVAFFVAVNKLSRHGIGHALFFKVEGEATLTKLWNRKLRFIFEKAFRFEPESMKSVRLQYAKMYVDEADAKLQ